MREALQLSVKRKNHETWQKMDEVEPKSQCKDISRYKIGTKFDFLYKS